MDKPKDDAPIDYTDPQHDRRKGPRRAWNVDDQLAAATGTDGRRGPDRRKKKPGFAGLFGALLSEAEPEEEPPEKPASE